MLLIFLILSPRHIVRPTEGGVIQTKPTSSSNGRLDSLGQCASVSEINIFQGVKVGVWSGDNSVQFFFKRKAFDFLGNFANPLFDIFHQSKEDETSQSERSESFIGRTINHL